MNDLPAFLTGGGRAATTIARFDWAGSPLGPMEQWPQSLKTALSMMLISSFPKAIVWGPDLVTFHNDAFAPILGGKPSALGRSFSDVWQEAWPELKPMVDKAFSGEATFIENFPLVIDRHGYQEQAYFTFCYSPIRIENGEVGGMMDTVIETTQAVLAQQRLAVMNAELAHRMRNLLTMVSAVTSMSCGTPLGSMRRRRASRNAWMPSTGTRRCLSPMRQATQASGSCSIRRLRRIRTCANACRCRELSCAWVRVRRWPWRWRSMS